MNTTTCRPYDIANRNRVAEIAETLGMTCGITRTWCSGSYDMWMHVQFTDPQNRFENSYQMERYITDNFWTI